MRSSISKTQVATVVFATKDYSVPLFASSSFSNTRSRLKLPGFWRGGLQEGPDQGQQPGEAWRGLP
jgi:hypothetical protein